MGRKLNLEGFRKLIVEDLEWLMKQPRTLEREHIVMALKESERLHYDLPELLGRIVREDRALREAGKDGLSDFLGEEIGLWATWLAGPRGD